MENAFSVKNRIVYFILIFFGIYTIFFQIHFDDCGLMKWPLWIADPTLSNSETIERQMKLTGIIQFCLI